MAENKPSTLYDLAKQGAKNNKAFAERAKSNYNRYLKQKAEQQRIAEEQSKALSDADESPERQAIYTPQGNGSFGSSIGLTGMGGANEQIAEIMERTDNMLSSLKPQEHNPFKVDASRIMQQNITQRAAQKMIEDPTSVKGVEDEGKEVAKYLGFEPYVFNNNFQTSITMQEAFDATDPLYESQGLSASFKYLDTLPTNKEGKIVVDGVPYSRMELAQAIAPQIVAQNSGSLFTNNATYRNDYFKGLGYDGEKGYIDHLLSLAKKLRNDLAKETWSEYDRYASPHSEASQIAFGLVNPQASGAKEINRIIDQIEGLQKDPTKWSEFASGFTEGFDLSNFLSFGTIGSMSEANKMLLYNKIANGESLTRKEQILRDALEISESLAPIQEMRPYSGWHNLGHGLGFTVEMTPQFLMPMALGKSLLKPINLGVKGAWKMIQKEAVSKGFASALKMGLGATARVGVKGLNNLARFQINGMITAPLQASTYSRFMEKRNAQYSFKNGQLVYKPTDAWRDLVDTWIEQGAEVGSELFGISLEKFLSSTLATIGRNIGLGKMMRKIGGSIRNVETSKALRFMKSGSTKTGQQLLGYAGGVVPEALSEIYGDLTSEMFKSVLTGNGNFEEFKNPTYWATAFALSGIYGGAMSVVPSVADYASYMHDISALGNKKKEALGKIEHPDLKNALIALSAGGSISDATKHLAELDWKNGGYSKTEIGFAMDYIRAEAMQQVRMGEATESQRLQRFGNVAKNIEAHAYCGEDGAATDSVIMAVDKDGNNYYILEGDYSNKEATLKALNSEGKVVPLLASNIIGLSKANVSEVTLFYYQEMFSNEFNMERLEMAEYAVEHMDNPTMEQTADVAKRVGIVMPKEGDTITLVDGRTAKVTSISDELGIMAEMIDGEGNVTQATIPIMQILSSNTYIAEAQKLQNANTALEKAQEEQAQAEYRDVVEDNTEVAETPIEDPSGSIVGREVALPNGRKGKVVEIEGDDVVVDTGRGVDAYEVYSMEELGMTETAEGATPQPTQTTEEVTPEQATEALNEIADIKAVPTLEDGSIDYEAIDDAETFAKHFEQDMGSREEAIKGVQEMREQTIAGLAEAEKKGKKARSANEKVANKTERQKLAERIALYDKVLDVYTPKAEIPATPEQAPQMDTIPSQAEAIDGAQTSETQPSTEGAAPATPKGATGLVEDEFAAQLDEKTRTTLDAVSKDLGVSVQFAPEIFTPSGQRINAKIDGNKVWFSWDYREHTISWLLGHEFTHRMKSLSPEAYIKLRDAMREYLGEEKWNQLIERQRKIYEDRDKPVEILSPTEMSNLAREAFEENENADGTWDSEVVGKAREGKLYKARREAYIEELVCDEVGRLVQDANAFEKFVKSEYVRKDSKLLNWLREVLRSIKGLFSRDIRNYNKMITALDNLIAESRSVVAKGAQGTGGTTNKTSLIGEKGALSLDNNNTSGARLRNLNIARQMEVQGKDALSIKMTTNWERGTDGLWRYEIDDYIDSRVINRLYEFNAQRATAIVKEERGILQSMYDGTFDLASVVRNSPSSTFSDRMRSIYDKYKDMGKMEMLEALNALSSKIEALDNGSALFTLEEVLGKEHPILNAYPQLSDVSVLSPKYKRGTDLGYYDHTNKTIMVRTHTGNTSVEANTLVHEIQHAIQHIEGFATGGNRNSVNPYAVAEKERIISETTEKLEVAKNLKAELEARNVEIEEVISAWENEHRDDDEKYPEDIEDMYYEQEGNKETLKTLANDIRGYERDLRAANNMHTTLGNDNYYRLAGEVEARTVAKRRSMTPEQRRSSLAVNDSDVAPEDRILIRDHKAMSPVMRSEEAVIAPNGNVIAETDKATGQARFSLMTYNEGGREAIVSFLQDRVKAKALTEAEMQQMVDDLERVYNICNELKDKYAPFGAWSEAKVETDKNGNPVFSVIKSNGDYAMNLDFSLVCKKRRTLDAVLNEMIKRGMINTLPDDPKEIAKINDVIRKYGFETACRLCFVDAKRFRVLKVANDFANMYNDMVDMLIPKGKKIPVNKFSYAVATEDVEGGLETMSDDALNIKALEKIGNKMKMNKEGKMVLDGSVPAKIARHLLAYPQDRRHVQASDFVSTLGFDNVKAQNPELLSLYNSKKGSGGPKASFSDVQYLNDILTQNWSAEAAYAVGGVRLQSFSDYVPRMVFDYIQMVADLAAKGLPVHAYTKEELFAKTFGLTGIKINLSLVPKVVEGGVAAGLDAEGNYTWQEGETFPYDVAVEIQNAEGYKENCGTIAVGVSDEQIWKMLDDSNIRMIIPYHKSGLAKKVAIHNNIAAFKDYTNVQNTRKGGKKVTGEEALKGMPNFNEEVRKTNDPRKAATAYLDWCKSKGYTPKFDKFASHPNYYKLLEDFTTLVDEVYMPQEAVTFTFPTEESAFGSLESLIERGLEEDAILEGQRDAKVGAIVDELQEASAMAQPKYSLITPEMDAAYLDAVERGDMATAQRMVMEAAEKAGYINDESWRMNHRAPRKDEENANPFNTEKIVPEDFWEHPEWYTNIRHSRETRESYYAMKSAIDKYKRLMAEGKTDEADNVTITMYRGVDKTANKREASFRNGDWITPSRSYALLSAPYGKARVISQEVKLKDIWWDGNSIDEWGYDDGANYGYRDTKNNRKLLAPVTYDDNGNVIPLSERFNPKKEDIRYSLSDRPTGLLNDFAEEFKNLQKEYESLDPTTIHSQHPFRIRKRKVVQKYLNHVSEVLGLPCEVFVLDSSNEQQVRTAYRKYVASRQANGKTSVGSYEEFKKKIKDVIGGYFEGTNLVVINIDGQDSINVNSEYLGAILHENAHKIIEGMGLDEKVLEAIYEEAQNLAEGQVKIVEERYADASTAEKGEEIITFGLQTRASFASQKDMLMQFFEGKVSEDDILKSFNKELPLRDKILKDILIALRDGYNNKHNNEYAYNNGGETFAGDTNKRLGSEHLRPSARGGLLSDTRYSLQSGDMPFFNDNGDIITFDNTDITSEDYDAIELRRPMPTTPRTTEDVIKAHLSARHNAAKERIRRESKILRDAVRKQYNEEQIRRREGVDSMRTNAAKVDYIIGAPIEDLDYEAQVLAMIAMGTLSISWESLAKELGVKSGDKKSYRHIIKETTATLDEVVHAWWEDINGYERGIDTQDLRNALIDVLMQVPTAKGALSILEDRFDYVLRSRDEALDGIDREEDRLIADEDARYNEQMATLSDPARMSEYIRQYEQTVSFHEELIAIEGTLHKMDSELKAVRKRAEHAQSRYKTSRQKQFDKSKDIIEKQRTFYKDKLAEQRASYKEVREAIVESKRALLEALGTYEQLGFNKQEVRSLVDAVNKARSMADVNKVRVKIENVILNISIREKRRHMDQMLNLRLPSGELVETWVSKQIHDGKMSVTDGKRMLADMFRGTNAKGVRVAKYIDDETARVMDYLRNNLVVPNHGGHYKDNVDAEGNIVGREYVPSREVETGTEKLLEDNNKRLNELLGKTIDGSITEEEQVELQARHLYESYLFVANARAYVKDVRAEGEKLYEDIQRKKAEQGDGYNKEERDADYAALDANALHLVEAKSAYDEALTEYNETLSNVIMGGRDKLREFREAKEAHKAKVVSMAINAIGGEARTIALQPTALEKLEATNRATVHSTYWTFDTTCREIDRFAPNGEGEFYKHFMGGMIKASNDFFTRTDNHVKDVCDAVRRITDSKRDPRRALRAFMRKADMTTVGSITYKDNDGKAESMPLRISNALFVLAMWGQTQYREIMAKRGITQEEMDSLKAKIVSIDERYIDFMEWVINTFLPNTRLEYNEVHKQMFGASMDNIENYFPAKVVEGYRDEDIAKVDTGLPSTMTGSIITRQAHNNIPEFGQSFFSVLLNHIQNMDQWASFSPLVEDLNAVISNPKFKALANTYMSGVNSDRSGRGSLWQIFKDVSAVAIGSYNCKLTNADSIVLKLMGTWAASNISWRFSTALKQLSGLTAVAVSGIGKTQGMFLKNMMLCGGAIKWAMDNSPMLQKRFGDRFAGNEALMRKYGQEQSKGLDLKKGKLKDALERVNDFIRFLTVDVGMTPNAAVDALVVSITMKTVYDVELSNLTKGKPKAATEEQKSYAMMKAEIFANETQQSAEGAYLSVPQAQRSAITAAMTTYLNATFASHRMRVQGIQDMYRWMSPAYRNEIDNRYGKGAARKAASKGLARLLTGISIDATFILMSRALGQGLWRLIIDWFDDTEDDDDEADPIDWSDIGWEIGFQTIFGGLLGVGSFITSLRNGFIPTAMPALADLRKDVFNIFGWTEKDIKDGDWSIDLNFWALGEITFKYGFGLDPETMLNIARGIEGICRDKDPMAAMKFLNTPQSMVNIIAGPRRNNETVQEYVERRARLEVLFGQPKYSELYDDKVTFIGEGKYAVVGGTKDYRLRSLAKEFNERQRAAVISKELTTAEIAEFERIDREYKAVVEPLGWVVGKNPVDDMVDKTTKKYKYPNGLTNKHYAALKEIATEAERTRRAQDKWVGTDKGYADLIRTEYNLRSEVIKGSKSVRSAMKMKAKIDKAEKERKKSQKK